MEMTIEVIKERMATFLKVPVSRIEDSMPLQEVVADSFMMVELLIELQEEYAIRLDQADLKDVATVSELTALIKERADAVALVEE